MTNLSEIQLSGEALVHNIRALRGIARKGTRIAAVVKGNAYGHGMDEVVRVLEPEVDCFQVDDIDELRSIRRVTQKDVLVFGYVPAGDLNEALNLGCEIAVYDHERLPVLDEAAGKERVKARIHLKIDALLGRQGVLPTDLDCIAGELKRHARLELVTAYAHFANIEDTTDLSHALAQMEMFEQCFERLKQMWPSLGRHLSSTSGLMTVERGSRNDLVRLGIGLYGLYPSAALARSHAELGLRPVMRWISHLAQIKTLSAGHPVGYGLTFITRRETKIGIVPQGYADGFDRGFSNIGEVLVRGRRCSVLGRVAMNMFAVDLSAIPEVEPEDEVVLLGAQGGQEITAEEMAIRLGTINYEITARVSPLIPRVM